MKICFRLDANHEIGFGHLFRCLNLANALRSVLPSAHIIFAGDFPDSGMIARLEDNQYEVLAGLSGAESLPETIYHDLKLVVVDHYGLGKEWEEPFGRRGVKVVAIDDLNNRQHACDLLTDQSFSKKEDSYKNLVPNNTELLIGAEYALLAESFQKARKNADSVTSIEKVLISFGGSDPEKSGLQFLKYLADCEDFEGLSYTLITGRDDLYFDEAINFAKSSSLKIIVKKFVEDMASEILSHDLMVGAGGVSCYERCCLKKPALTFMTADNQYSNIRGLADAGAIVYLGAASEMSKDHCVVMMRKVVSYAALEMSKKASEICDGKGCERVASQIKRLVEGGMD